MLIVYFVHEKLINPHLYPYFKAMNQLTILGIVGVSVLIASVFTFIPIPNAYAPPSQATLKCKGPGTFSATVTWFWTLRGVQIPGSGGTLSCTDNGTAGPVSPNRPQNANDYHRDLTVSDLSTGKSNTCSVDSPVARSFSDHENCRLKDPAGARFALSTPAP